jgi:hypothetical protein
LTGTEEEAVTRKERGIGTEEEAVTGKERGIGTEKETGIGIMTGMTGTVVMTEVLIVTETETEKGRETGTPAGPTVMTPGAATALVLQGIIGLEIMITTGRK